MLKVKHLSSRSLLFSLVRLILLSSFAFFFLSGCRTTDSSEGSVENSVTASIRTVDLGLLTVNMDNALSSGISSLSVSGAITTASAYKTSFLDTLEDEYEVIYLGKPKNLRDGASADCEWSSSDESVAIVRDGIVVGLKEGIVTVTQSDNGTVVSTHNFAVTTFNDGHQVELSYALGEKAIAEMLAPESAVPSPYYLKQNINTIQDAISYFRLCGFDRRDDLPLMCNPVSDWIWFVPGDFVLMENGGISEDIATAADYLLSDDFEDRGFIYAFGSYYSTINWFYEDGFYYAFSFGKMIKDFSGGIRDASYEIFRTDDLSELAQYALEIAGNNDTMAVVMLSSAGHDFRPAMRMSYLHDSTVIYHKHVNIGFEAEVFNHANILYTNPSFDLEILAVPDEEIPAGIPRYGTESGYKY